MLTKTYSFKKDLVSCSKLFESANYLSSPAYDLLFPTFHGILNTRYDWTELKTHNYKIQVVCMIPLLARSLGLKVARLSVRATIWYRVYKDTI